MKRLYIFLFSLFTIHYSQAQQSDGEKLFWLMMQSGANSSNLISWYKANQGVNIVDGGVNSWSDLSGNNRTLTAPSSVARPSLSGGAIVFNGATDLRADYNIGSQYSVYVVNKFTVLNKTLLRSLISNGAYLFYQDGANTMYQRPASSFVSAPCNNALVTSTNILSALRDASGVSFYSNGNLLGSGSLPAGDTFQFQGVAGEGGFAFQGEVREIRIYNTKHSAAEAAAVINELKNTWGL